MREIKFRAYCDSRMKYQPELEWCKCGAGYMIRLLGDNGFVLATTLFDDPKFELMQYTGLKDKNGLTEIYEGDILRCSETGHSYQADVRWVENGFWLVDERGQSHMPIEKYREVIGNIYENIELLK